MKQKRSNDDPTTSGESSAIKRAFLPKTSIPIEYRTSIEQLEYELQKTPLDMQSIGKIISDGIAEKSMNDEKLKELTTKLSKNISAIANINIFLLSNELSRGTFETRYLVVGNAFLWNLLKASMSIVRDKFDHYHFKMSSLTATTSSLNSVEFSSTRTRAGEHVTQETDVFRKIDLLEVYNSVVFRKTGDLNSKSKQFIKAYFSIATKPKCAIWHYSLRQSGTSHKKWLHDIPAPVLDTISNFLLSLAGLGEPQLEHSFAEIRRTDYARSLGDTDDAREVAFDSLKTAREQLVSKFRQNVTDALNETREMPYNTITRELMAPPRGKPIDMHHCITWRQYESLIKRCDSDPSKENLEAREHCKMMLNFDKSVEEEEVEIDVEAVEN